MENDAKNKTGVSTLASQKRPGSPPPELLANNVSWITANLKWH
jgi:hypothetical protein